MGNAMTAVQYLEVPVGELRPNPFNPNRVSAENEKKIRESIRRNGIFKPIIVRVVASVTGYEIIGGQHRWEQAKELGLATVPIVNLGEIDDKRAKEIGVLDNARYGADDTLSLSTILKDIGDAAELQSFLPYIDTDLTAIFSAASIDLDDLEIPETEQDDEEDAPAPAPATSAPARTHTLMRFKIGLLDAERLTKLIAQTQRDHGFKTEDELTNAGDALIHLLMTAGLMKSTPANTAPAKPAEWDDMLDEIEAAQKEAEND
jgi:ParB-like chromosome segregation protein Spo0J